MAQFASTTLSGYSDPLRAQSIKALEKRQADLLAQQAAQKDDTALMATIPGGIGHVLGVVGDNMRQARTEQAVAEGKNELAAIIAQGPKGADGNWAPEQLAGMARRAPELMEKFYQQQHEAKQLATTEGGLNTRNTATITGQNQRSDAEIAGRKEVANLQETGATARNTATNATTIGTTGMTLSSREKEGALDRAAASEAQESKQDQEIRVARLNADLAQAQKDRDNAFASGETAKAQAHDKDVTRLKSELASGEARQSERFQASQLNSQIASNEKIQALQREATTANTKLQIAANSGDKVAQQEADKDLARINGAIQQQRDLIKQDFDARQQSNQIRSTEKMSADEIASKDRAAAAKAAADAHDPEALQRKADAEKKLTQESALVAELDDAHAAFKKGINLGPEGAFKTGAANLPFVGSYLGDREQAARTRQVNNAMEKVATGAMSTILKGATTDKEMAKFITLWNDPSVPYEAKVNQFGRVLDAAKADRDSQAAAVKGMGGVDRSAPAAAPAAAAGPPRPEGKDDGALISEAKAAILKGKNPEAVKKQLDAWGVKRGSLMGAFDHIPDATEGPPAPAGAFDHIPDEPKSGGAFAAKELTREQEIRRDLLMKMVSERKPGYEERAADELSMGMIYPVAGVKALVEGKAKEWFGDGKPATAGDYYRGGVMATKDYVKQGEENTPGPAGAAVSLGGALAGGSGGPKVVGRAGQAGIAALQGLIGGASRNAEDAGSATGGGLIGAGVNAGAQHMVSGLLDRFFRGAKKDIGVASRGGGSQSVEADASAIFKKLDDAGIHYKGADTAPLAGNTAQRLADVGFNANMQKQLTPALAEIGAMSGQNTTWTQLRNMQQQVSKLKASGDPNLRRVAGELDDEINGFINSTKPVMPASSVAAGINPARDVAEAKRLWHTGSKADTVEALSEIGTRKAANPTDKVERNFEGYQDRFKKNPNKYNPFGNNPEQMRLMDKIVEGDPGLAKWGPRLDTYGNRLAGFGLLGAAGTAAGPLTGAYDVTDKTGGTIAGTIAAGLALKGAGGGLRQIAAERGAARVNDLIRNIVTGSTAQAPGAYAPRDALARLIAKQDLAQGAGNYATSFINQGNPQP